MLSLIQHLTITPKLSVWSVEYHPRLLHLLGFPQQTLIVLIEDAQVSCKHFSVGLQLSTVSGSMRTLAMLHMLCGLRTLRPLYKAADCFLRRSSALCTCFKPEVTTSEGKDSRFQFCRKSVADCEIALPDSAPSSAESNCSEPVKDDGISASKLTAPLRQNERPFQFSEERSGCLVLLIRERQKKFRYQGYPNPTRSRINWLRVIDVNIVKTSCLAYSQEKPRGHQKCLEELRCTVRRGRVLLKALFQYCCKPYISSNLSNWRVSS